MRSTDHEASGRVDEELCICVYHLLRKDLIKYIFLDVLMDLLLSHILIMLCGKNDCVKAERLSVLIVLNCNLGLSVRSQVRKSSVLSDLGETSCKLMRKSDRIRHVLLRLIACETEHHTLITSTDRIQLIVCHVVLFRFKRLVNTHSDIAGLLVDCSENTAGITVETIFCTVIADLTDGLADDLLDIHICLCCDLAHYHNKTCCCACLTCNTAHRILFH